MGGANGPRGGSQKGVCEGRGLQQVMMRWGAGGAESQLIGGGCRGHCRSDGQG